MRKEITISKCKTRVFRGQRAYLLQATWVVSTRGCNYVAAELSPVEGRHPGLCLAELTLSVADPNRSRKVCQLLHTGRKVRRDHRELK